MGFLGFVGVDGRDVSLDDGHGTGDGGVGKVGEDLLFGKCVCVCVCVCVFSFNWGLCVCGWKDGKACR
jgi:hypothetical protein